VDPNRGKQIVPRIGTGIKVRREMPVRVSGMADDVRLTDLEVIQRWSIAVRGERADRAELAAALRADLAFVEGARAPRTTRSTPRADKPVKAAKPVARSAAKPAKRAAATARGRR
jgi:hypothetical protein